MRRVLAVLCGLIAATAVAANAAVPAADSHFSGSGTVYQNKGKAWKPGGRETFTFRTSAAGSRIVAFRGAYSYCSGAATLSAGYLTVSPRGRFDYAFSVRSKTGTFYAQIYGQFLRGGARADVDYLVDFVAKGKKVSHPYDTAHPQALGCASWVRGTAKAG